MAKGAEAKEVITQILSQIFPNAFMDGKIFRVPVIESSGDAVEIKITLTAAKDLLKEASTTTDSISSMPIYRITPEEKAEIVKLLASLGIE